MHCSWLGINVHGCVLHRIQEQCWQGKDLPVMQNAGVFGKPLVKLVHEAKNVFRGTRDVKVPCTTLGLGVVKKLRQTVFSAGK